MIQQPTWKKRGCGTSVAAIIAIAAAIMFAARKRG